MKVLLVNPIDTHGYSFPNLGLGYLASAVKKDGHNVKILDCQNKRLNFKQFLRYTISYNPDVIGFRTYIPNLLEVKKSIEYVKEWKSSVKVVIGGVYVSTVSPDESMGYFNKADYGFRGEGEVGLPLLLKNLESKGSIDMEQIPGLLWRNGGKILENPPMFVKNLDSLDFPAWDLMPPIEYNLQTTYFIMKNRVSAPIITTRGCPYRCTFCSVPSIWGHKVRIRSVENVIKEIILLHDKYDVGEIVFTDGTFGVNRRFVQNLCNAIIQNNLNMYFRCDGIRLENLDEQTLTLMDKAGFYFFTVGVESGSEYVLKDMNKKLNLRVLEKKMLLIKENTRIKIGGNFIIGYPSEDVSDIHETIKIARRLPFTTAAFNGFTPLPSTPIFDKLVSNGEIKQKTDYNLYGTLVYSPKFISKSQLLWLHKYAYLSFYLRFKILRELIKNIKGFWQIKLIFKRVVLHLLKSWIAPK